MDRGIKGEIPPETQFALGFEAGWYAAIDAAIKETESLTGDKGTTSSGLSRTFRTLAKLKKLRVEHKQWQR